MTRGDGPVPRNSSRPPTPPATRCSCPRLIGQAGGTPQALDVQADVSLGPDPAGGFRLTGIKLTVRGEVEGLDAEQFRQAAEAAKAGCPVSKALTGVDITLDAALES